MAKTAKRRSRRSAANIDVRAKGEYEARRRRWKTVFTKARMLKGMGKEHNKDTKILVVIKHQGTIHTITDYYNSDPNEEWLPSYKELMSGQNYFEKMTSRASSGDGQQTRTRFARKSPRHQQDDEDMFSDTSTLTTLDTAYDDNVDGKIDRHIIDANPDADLVDDSPLSKLVIALGTETTGTSEKSDTTDPPFAAGGMMEEKGSTGCELLDMADLDWFQRPVVDESVVDVSLAQIPPASPVKEQKQLDNVELSPKKRLARLLYHKWKRAERAGIVSVCMSQEHNTLKSHTTRFSRARMNKHA